MTFKSWTKLNNRMLALAKTEERVVAKSLIYLRLQIPRLKELV